MESRLALFVEPDPQTFDQLQSAFATWRVEPRQVKLGAELDEALRLPAARFVVADAGNGAIDSILDRLPATEPQPIVIALVSSGDGDVSRWDERGLFDLLHKPLDASQLRLAVRRAVRRQQLLDEVDALRGNLRTREGYQGLVGRSLSMQRLREELARLAPLDGPVWLHGEDGCGKRLAAHTLHQRSGRGQAAFAALDCESASRDPDLASRLALAQDGASAPGGIWNGLHGGTLMVAEPGALDAPQQETLLHSLEQSRSAGIDARCIVVSKLSPERQVEEGRLMGEVAARLATDAVGLAPLRERREDIPLLAAHFVEAISTINRLAPLKIGGDAMQRLESCSWRDNVRGLRDALERAAIVCEDGTIRAGDLPANLSADPVAKPGVERTSSTAGATFRQAKGRVVEAFELDYLDTLMRRHDGNVTAASHESGMLRSALQRLLRKHGLKSSSFRRSRGARKVAEREETHASHS